MIKGIALGAVALLVVVGVAFALDFAGLVYQRHTAPYAQQTATNTYRTSAQYQDGTAEDLDDLCRQYKSATDQSIKDGLADSIRLRSSHYDGPLPAHVQECVDAVH